MQCFELQKKEFHVEYQDAWVVHIRVVHILPVQFLKHFFHLFHDTSEMMLWGGCTYYVIRVFEKGGLG